MTDVFEEISEIQDKLDLFKDSFNEIMDLLNTVKIRQKAIEDLLIIREVIDKQEIDYIEDALKYDFDDNI